MDSYMYNTDRNKNNMYTIPSESSVLVILVGQFGVTALPFWDKITVVLLLPSTSAGQPQTEIPVLGNLLLLFRFLHYLVIIILYEEWNLTLLIITVVIINGKSCNWNQVMVVRNPIGCGRLRVFCFYWNPFHYLV